MITMASKGQQQVLKLMMLLLLVFISFASCLSPLSNQMPSAYDLFDLAQQASSSLHHLDSSQIGHKQSTKDAISCSEMPWCETTDPNYFEGYDDAADEVLRGFWLEPPPDDIVYMPPPPMPPAIQAALFGAESNISVRDYIINTDAFPSDRSEPLCNFCKLFADPRYYPFDGDDDTSSIPIGTDGGFYDDGSTLFVGGGAHHRDNRSYVSSFYLLIFSVILVSTLVGIALIKYKK